MKPTHAFCLFDTALGRCAIGWSAAGVFRMLLPSPDDSVTRNMMRDTVTLIEEIRPPKFIALAIERIVALFEGGKDNLRTIDLDMTGVPEFHRAVYALTREIPPGETRTYGDIAKDLGDVALSRAVGVALGANPFPIVVPCHRIVGANGKMTGFSAPGGVETKMRMLTIERARLSKEPTLFDNDQAFVLAQNPRGTRRGG
jgi:methylated-DNA-[protein]-cysteine S-methyltransferase